MLYRKIAQRIENFLLRDPNKMLIVDGARQIGKSYIIRWVGQKLFPNYIEINMEEDRISQRAFANATSVQDFYMVLSSIAGDKLQDKQSTLIFIDEIQAYDHLLTLAKFLVADNRYTFIASGSQLGIALRKTTSIPIGSIAFEHMYPLDFEEFVIANGVGEYAREEMRKCFHNRETLPEAIHNRMMDLFRKYLLVGGLPEAVNHFVETNNVMRFREVQRYTHNLYSIDATKYEAENGKKLKIKRIYDMVPSTLENKKKRIVIKDIENQTWKRFDNYIDEFEYLISSGITLEVKAVSTPTYPLIANSSKNLLKLYMNDVGILSAIYYGNNIEAIMADNKSVNLGALYETVVAQELRAHGYDLYYYDNKKNGEVDFLIDDMEHLSNIPIEVKSGKDYKVHSALDTFVTNKDYHIHQAIVLSNEPQVFVENGITYMPIYYIMFFEHSEFQ